MLNGKYRLNPRRVCDKCEAIKWCREEEGIWYTGSCQEYKVKCILPTKPFGRVHLQNFCSGVSALTLLNNRAEALYFCTLYCRLQKKVGLESLL